MLVAYLQFERRKVTGRRPNRMTTKYGYKKRVK